MALLSRMFELTCRCHRVAFVANIFRWSASEITLKSFIEQQPCSSSDTRHTFVRLITTHPPSFLAQHDDASAVLLQQNSTCKDSQKKMATNGFALYDGCQTTVLDAVDVAKKFECGVYSLMHVPRVLEINYWGVYTHKNGPYQDEIQSLEQMNWYRDKILIPNLKSASYGDYMLLVGLINMKYFGSREKLDSLFSEEWKSSESCDPNSSIETVECITFENALKMFNVSVSCNMDYYLSNRDEMEKDLGHSMDITSEDTMNHLEWKLFYNQIVKVFGENDSSEDIVSTGSAETKSVTFRDFRLLFADGNDVYATARRGNYYVVFYYVTS